MKRMQGSCQFNEARRVYSMKSHCNETRHIGPILDGSRRRLAGKQESCQSGSPHDHMSRCLHNHTSCLSGCISDHTSLCVASVCRWRLGKPQKLANSLVFWGLDSGFPVCIIGESLITEYLSWMGRRSIHSWMVL